jgi:hypothetical protein
MNGRALTMNTTKIYSAEVLPILRPECKARADRAREGANNAGITGQMPYPPTYSAEEIRRSIAQRMTWDAYAAAEYPRPILADAMDAAALRPELADEIWHQTAGATILFSGCDCASPAVHRDNLTLLAALL